MVKDKHESEHEAACKLGGKEPGYGDRPMSRIGPYGKGQGACVIENDACGFVVFFVAHAPKDAGQRPVQAGQKKHGAQKPGLDPHPAGVFGLLFGGQKLGVPNEPRNRGDVAVHGDRLSVDHFIGVRMGVVFAVFFFPPKGG